MKKIYTLFLFCLGMSAAVAQDARFSQFTASPMTLNPAMTGVMEGGFRAMANYRSQWGSFLGSNAYRTYSIGADFRLLGPRNDYWGIGGVFVGDRAGALGYQQMQGTIGFNYQKMLGRPKAWKKGSNFLIGGAQLGFGQRGADWSGIQTSMQFNGNGFDPTYATGEGSTLLETRTFMDLNAGLMYYSVSGPRSSYYFGLAAHHINTPTVSLTKSTKDKLYMRTTIHGGAEIPLGKYKRGGHNALSLLPSGIIMMQGPSMEINAGLNLKYRKDKQDDIAFKAGLWTRLVNDAVSSAPRPDALIFNAAIEVGTIQCGLSYDVNVSSLQQATQGKGGVELSLIYINPKMGQKNKGCPSF